MAFDLTEFKSAVAKKGLLPTNKYKLRITAPPALQNTNVRVIENKVPAETPMTTSKDLEFFCDSVTLPGILTVATENYRYGYGPVDKKPFTQTFSDMACTFLVDGNGDNIRFFQSWKKLIINNDVRKSMLEQTGIVQGQFPFEVAYKEDYAVDMQLMIYNNSGTVKEDNDWDAEAIPALTFTFQEAFPLTLFDLPLNWADNNNMMRFAVIFTYRTYYEDTLIYTPNDKQKE